MDWRTIATLIATALVSGGVVGGVGQTAVVAPERQAFQQMDKAHDACQANLKATMEELRRCYGNCSSRSSVTR